MKKGAVGKWLQAHNICRGASGFAAIYCGFSALPDSPFYILEKNNDKKLGLGHIFHMNHEEKGDVARNVKTIIDLSGYDNENKGAYKAAIVDKRN